MSEKELWEIIRDRWQDDYVDNDIEFARGDIFALVGTIEEISKDCKEFRARIASFIERFYEWKDTLPQPYRAQCLHLLSIGFVPYRTRVPENIEDEWKPTLEQVVKAMEVLKKGLRNGVIEGDKNEED